MLREFFHDLNFRHRDVYFAVKRKDRVLAKKFDKLWIRRIAADYYLKLPASIYGFEGDFYKKINCDENDVKKVLTIAEEIITIVKSHFKQSN